MLHLVRIRLSSILLHFNTYILHRIYNKIKNKIVIVL